MGFFGIFGGKEDKAKEMATQTERVSSNSRDIAIKKLESLGGSAESLKRAKIEESLHSAGGKGLDGVIDAFGQKPFTLEGEVVTDGDYLRVSVESDKGSDVPPTGFRSARWKVRAGGQPAMHSPADKPETHMKYESEVDGVRVYGKEAQMLFEKLSAMESATEAGGERDQEQIRHEVARENASQDVKEL